MKIVDGLAGHWRDYRAQNFEALGLGQHPKVAQRPPGPSHLYWYEVDLEESRESLESTTNPWSGVERR